MHRAKGRVAENLLAGHFVPAAASMSSTAGARPRRRTDGARHRPEDKAPRRPNAPSISSYRRTLSIGSHRPVRRSSRCCSCSAIRASATPTRSSKNGPTQHSFGITARGAERAPMSLELDGINPAAEPSGTGCVECLATNGWWLHLRRCAECGHIGCCDSSPSQHATKHGKSAQHPIITSFEHGEHWFYDYRSGEFIEGPKLPPPHSHPVDQPVPGPAGRVPANWQSLLHQ
jgi:hypothetical protein